MGSGMGGARVSAAAGRTAPEWRPFLRALAEELDTVAGASGRDALLRAVGTRMARLLPLPEVASVDGLEMEMNDALAVLGWGGARLSFSDAERALTITHAGLPRLGAAGTPPGTWLAALLEGLYETWMLQQPGSDATLVARLAGPPAADQVVLRFGRP